MCKRLRPVSPPTLCQASAFRIFYYSILNFNEHFIRSRISFGSLKYEFNSSSLIDRHIDYLAVRGEQPVMTICGNPMLGVGMRVRSERAISRLELMFS